MTTAIAGAQRQATCTRASRPVKCMDSAETTRSCAQIALAEQKTEPHGVPAGRLSSFLSPLRRSSDWPWTRLALCCQVQVDGVPRLYSSASSLQHCQTTRDFRLRAEFLYCCGALNNSVAVHKLRDMSFHMNSSCSSLVFSPKEPRMDPSSDI